MPENVVTASGGLSLKTTMEKKENAVSAALIKSYLDNAVSMTD